MSRCIITTVGLSTLTNARRVKGIAEPNRADLIQYVKDDPAGASAEMKVLQLLKVDTGDRVELLHTNTEQCMQVAETLKSYLEGRGIAARSILIDELAGSESAMRNAGLFALGAKMVELIEFAKKEGLEPILNMNGGYKSETATALAVATAEGVPTYYSHETHGALVKVPPLPVVWDEGLFATADTVLDLLETVPTVEQFEADLAKLEPDLQVRLRTLVVMEEGLVITSPLVHAAYRRFRQKEAFAELAPVMLSKRAAGELAESGSHGSRFQTLIRRAAMIAGSTYWESKTGCPDILFGPKGPVDEHIGFYREGETVVIVAMWTQNEGYKKEINSKHGLHRSDHPGMQPWNPA